MKMGTRSKVGELAWHKLNALSPTCYNSKANIRTEIICYQDITFKSLRVSVCQAHCITLHHSAVRCGKVLDAQPTTVTKSQQNGSLKITWV